MDTPICDFVKEYASSDFSRFHMPGHKGKEFVGCEMYDITEIEGADVLSHADGIIKKSQENAAKLFGSGASFDTAAAGMEGEELADELRKYKIECEYADKYFVVLMITPQNDEKDFERLEKWAADTKDKRAGNEKIEPKKLILHKAERMMSIREAAFSPYKKIKVSNACDSICASQTIACPPAIPIAVCGERIDENMIGIFEEYGIEYVNVVSC